MITYDLTLKVDRLKDNLVLPYHNETFCCENEKNVKICNATENKEHDHSQALFYKGILFSHDLNKKGKFLYFDYSEVLLLIVQKIE